MRSGPLNVEIFCFSNLNIIILNTQIKSVFYETSFEN